jgi:hypothetical protein
MASEKDLRELEVSRGERARGLLGDPLVNEVLEHYEKALMARWARSEVGRTDERETVYFMVCALREVRAGLTRFVETGKLASMQLESMSEAKR